MTPDEQISSDQLKKIPYFRPFLEPSLLAANPIPCKPQDNFQRKVKYDVLARGIPALSFAAGQGAVGAFGESRNYNMETRGRVEGRWPSDGHTDHFRSGRWIHSDFKNVALPYVAPMYQAMIIQASLAIPL